MTERQTDDGRRRRALTNRARIVAALMDLVRDGELTPTAEAVAERSGVGLRTVFRHFRDMDALHQEIAAAIAERLLPQTLEPLTAHSWRGRVEELARRRARLFEELAPFVRANDAHRARSPLLQAERVRLTRFQREMLERLLPQEALAAPALVEALDVALSVDAWRRLREDQGLSPSQAEAALLFAARALCAAV